YLSSIQVVNNQLTTLSVSNLPSLQNIHVPNNQLSNYSIINCPNLQTLTLNNNLITSVNISDFPNLLTLQCDNNLISSITLNNNIGLKNIVANNNQLSDISFFEAPNLENLYINNNLFTNINLGLNPQLGNFDFSYNPYLTHFNIKNGNHNYSQGAFPQFSNTPNLLYICADDDEATMLPVLLNFYNQPNVVINSYCNFVPGGIYYTIQGNFKLDVNGDGCDTADPAKAFPKFNISGNSGTGMFIGNQTGNYSVPVFTGSHIITPVLENP